MLLLTTVCRPLGGPDQGPSMGVDVMAGQLCVNQGAFRTSGVGWAYGLEYMAANLRRPTVVLHWPSRRELIRELRRGSYDDVGITFTFQLLPKLAETVEVVRRYAPGARIILGGYGTAADEAAAYGDEVCSGEGIAFMRQLLDEEVGAPLVHPTIVYGNRLLSLPVRAGRKIVLCTGLGCATGCDFCASSHKFRRRYIPLVRDGDELFSVMNDLYQRTGIDEFQVLDENFLVQRRRAERLADRCQEAGRHFEFFTFASVNSLANYSADELCRVGVSAVWIGLEGKQAGYDKLHGEQLHALVRRLKHHGILVCGSMIIGFDYQTPEVIRQELEEILEAGPTYLQCLVYGPTPGTPLWERLEQQGRWVAGGRPGQGVPYGRCDGFVLGFKHPQISGGQMASLQRECYDRDLEHGGHSIFRVVETWLEGYLNLRGSAEDFLRARARVYRRKLEGCRPLVAAGIPHAPNARARQRLEQLQRALRTELGPPSLMERAAERLLLPAAARFTELRLRHGLLSEPALIRRTYRC